MNTTPNNSSSSSSHVPFGTNRSNRHQIYCQNVNGLLTKLNQLYAEVLAAEFPIYIFTETGFNDSTNSITAFPSNYTVHRGDRSGNTTSKKSGGGVLIAVDKQFDSDLLFTGDDDGCEQVWVKIKSNDFHLVVASIYIPPDQPIEKYSAHMSCMSRFLSEIGDGTDILIYGDFNLPKLKWQLDEITNSMIPINIEEPVEREVLFACHENGLLQTNDIPNANGRLLDLVWTNNTEKFECNLC